MNIHPEGRKITIWVLVVLVLILLTISFFVSPYLLVICILAATFLLAFMLYFFRHPERNIESSDVEIISPADGKVIILEKIFEKEYFKKDMMKISIFMSVWDVHLNRVPINGLIAYQKYHPGKYLIAANPKASDLNERNTVVIKTKSGEEVLTRQIAGGVARRIRPYTVLEEEVKRGQELGFIRFGSRLDLFIPVSAEIKVKLGEKVKGNISLIARLQ